MRCNRDVTRDAANLFSARSAIIRLYHGFFDMNTFLHEPWHVVLYFVHQRNLVHDNMAIINAK